MDTLMDYFAKSPFYSTASCNEHLMMQFRHRMDIEDRKAIRQQIELELHGMSGLQYTFHEEESSKELNIEARFLMAPLFIIKAIERTSPDNFLLKAIYYVMGDGKIRQCPRLIDAIKWRMTGSAAKVWQAFALAHEAVVLDNNLGFHIPNNTNTDDDRGETISLQKRADESLVQQALNALASNEKINNKGKR